MKKLAAWIFAVLLCVMPSQKIFANSAIKHWTGSSGSGVISADENCPVVVTHEDLTIHTATGSLGPYAVTEAYDAYAEASYTLYNPTDMDINARLVFPFGIVPDYAPHTEDDSYLLKDYWITLNGNPLEAALRYTYEPSMDNFRAEEALSRLSDTYREHPFFRPSLPAAEYIFTLTGLPETAENCELSFDLDFSKLNTVLVMEYRSISWKDQTISLTVSVQNGETFRIIALGDDPVPALEFRLKTPDAEESSPYPMTPDSLRTYDYEEFAGQFQPGDSLVSKVDWYNCLTDYLDKEAYQSNRVFYLHPREDLRVPVMRWYDYTIALGPKESSENTVHAPIYPDIDASYDHTVYEYKYLLTPAKTWGDFKDLHITVESDLYMIGHDREVFPFKKTDKGFEVTLEKLPDKDLSVRMCEVDSPKKQGSDYLSIILIFLGAALVFFSGIIALIVTILRAIRKRR